MTRTRKALLALTVLLLLPLAGLLAYVLPQHAVVHVDGTDIRYREGGVSPSGPTSAPLAPGKDIYYINTSNPERTEVRVFRNQDTGFGFPWYFKFDSAEVQGRAQLLQRGDGQLALVTYYGWRIPVLKLFPNAVDVQAWSSLEEPLPVFNIGFLALLAVLLGGGAWKLRRWRQRRAQQAAT